MKTFNKFKNICQSQQTSFLWKEIKETITKIVRDTLKFFQVHFPKYDQNEQNIF